MVMLPRDKICLCRLDATRRENGYWEDFDNLKQELVSIASGGRIRQAGWDSSLQDPASFVAEEGNDPSLPLNAPDGKNLSSLCLITSFAQGVHEVWMLGKMASSIEHLACMCRGVRGSCQAAANDADHAGPAAQRPQQSDQGHTPVGRPQSSRQTPRPRLPSVRRSPLNLPLDLTTSSACQFSAWQDILSSEAPTLCGPQSTHGWGPKRMHIAALSKGVVSYINVGRKGIKL